MEGDSGAMAQACPVDRGFNVAVGRVDVPQPRARARCGRDHGTSMDDGQLPVRPSAVVAAYLLAALCVLIPLAVVGSTFAGIVLWRRGLRSHGAAVVGLGVACGVFGVAALL
jgi:hypothetical protein